MFSDATRFDSDLSLWNAGKVTNMSCMFSTAVMFDGDLSLWNIGNGTDFTGILYQAARFSHSLCMWEDKLGGRWYHNFGMFGESGCPSLWTRSRTDLGVICVPDATPRQ
jgi:Mycoplasma protein of unknown function, DUF285